MDTIDCIRGRRTIRLFNQEPIICETLLELIDLARLSPSGANRQPLEYIIVNDGEVIRVGFRRGVIRGGRVVVPVVQVPGRVPRGDVVLD